MSTVITSQIVTKEALLNYENSLVLGNRIDWSHSEKFGKDNQIGQILYVRRPVMTSVISNNLAYGSDTNATAVDTFVSMGVATTQTVSLTFSEVDMTLRIEDFSKRYIKTSTRIMANQFDSMIANAISNAGGGKWQTSIQAAVSGNTTVSTGVGGWVFESSTSGKLSSEDVLNARVLLEESACPDDGDIFGVLSPKANALLSSSQLTLFNAQKEISSIYKTGFLGEFAGVMWATSPTVATHINGAQTSLTVGAGSVVLTSGWAETGALTVTATGNDINAGDVFSVAGVYWVNPLTKQTTSTLAQFTVTEDVGSGATTIPVSPAPITSGQYQNISATVASKTATLIGSASTAYVESYMFHKSAIGAASPKLYSDSKEGQQEERSEETGLSIRFTRAYDAIGARPSASGVPGWVNRLDTLSGIKILRPEWIVRIRVKA